MAHYKGHVYLNTDPGALCRPVLNVSQLHKIPTLAQNHPDNLFECLRNHGVIQYLEKLEESEYVIATDLAAVERLNARFVEIHPSVILGLCASLIPCCDFNQSPRNTYQSAMGKQSCGTYLSNYLVRHDTVAYTLCYPQRPLVHNWVDDVTGLNALPAGQNLLVAVGCYGYNMEDSIVFNRAFIERGGGRAFVYRSHSEQESPSGNDVFKLERPEDDIAKKHGNYSKLNAEGVVPVDVAVESGDALIGKTVESYVPGSSERVKKDCSHIYRYSGGVVDQVVRTINRDGLPLVRVRTRSLRLPMIGDKFTSRHGQKGIIGKILESEDMPFNADGISPDIIINPHAIPSRMTVGHLFESLLGTAACLQGQFADGTPFRNIAVQDVAKVIGARPGRDCYGNMDTTTGVTGRKLKDRLSYGWVYYQRLKHMAADKMHARQRGPVALQTKQPLEGRSRDGGLRFGEMEGNCVQAEGASAVLQERLFFQSDPTVVPVCSACGLIAEPPCNPRDKRFAIRSALQTKAYCRRCNTGQHVMPVRMPYSCKLLLQELYTVHIAPRLRIAEG